MVSITKTLIVLMVVCGFFAATAMAQQNKAPDYKISKIKIVPFDSQTGEFEEELTTDGQRSFFNDLSISLLVLVEISGEAGSFEVGRKINVTVTEGTRPKASRNEQIGLIGSGGKWYEALWLQPAMCSDVKITASITGQKPSKAVTRKIPFLCGE